MYHIVRETSETFDKLGRATTIERARELKDWYKKKLPRGHDVRIIYVKE